MFKIEVNIVFGLNIKSCLAELPGNSSAYYTKVQEFKLKY